MILYYSATGNSEFIAKELAFRLGDDCLNLLKRIKTGDYSAINSSKPFVIVAPVYVCEMPRFLSKFLKRVELTGSKDCYFVFTSGGYPGMSTTLAKGIIRRKKMNYKGRAELKMPRNYIASNAYSQLEDDEIANRLVSSYKEIPIIVETIQDGKNLKSRYVWLFEKIIILPFNPVWCKIKQPTKPFRVTDKCVGCKRCESLCPLNRIKIVEGKPVWDNKVCAHCMSCIQNCPTEAIEFGEITPLKKRYTYNRYKKVIDQVKEE